MKIIIRMSLVNKTLKRDMRKFQCLGKLKGSYKGLDNKNNRKK